MSASALKLVDVHKYFGSSHIMRGLNLEVPKGERHAIIGPNGAGKSTLFNLISGRYAPSSGTVELNRQPINGQPP
jgi:branched-chain amino acid transport system ATP-binding protein